MMRPELNEELKSKVYNALSEVVFDIETKNATVVSEKEMEESIEWFLIHFFETR